MNRQLPILAAAALTAAALVAPAAGAQTVQDVQQQLGLGDIPDPDQDPSPPADDAPDTDPADAPDPGEPPDPADDNTDPPDVAMPAATPVVTPEVTPVTTPVATVETVATDTPTPGPSPVATATPVVTPVPTATATAAAVASPTPTSTVAAAREVTPRKVARAPRPANGRRVSRGIATRAAGRPAPAAAYARPVVRVRAAQRTLLPAAPRAGEYVVRRGDTLSAIAVRCGMTWPALWALNRDRIADPDMIYPGEVLRT